MMIKYLRKPGKIIGYEIELNHETEEMELIPIFAKGTPYGCLYAKKICDEVGMYRISVGWSLCSKKDSFSKDEAVLIAAERANEKHNSNMIIPHSIRNEFVSFCERAKKYYRLNNFTHKYVIVKEEVLNVQTRQGRWIIYLRFYLPSY